jgi:hypothetical protein
VVQIGFGNIKHPGFHRLAQVKFWVVVASVLVSPVYVGLVEMHKFLHISSIFADRLL